MKIAAHIADEAFHHISYVSKPGISENDVRDELEFFMRKKELHLHHFKLL